MRTIQVLIVNKQNKDELLSEIINEDGIILLVNKPKNWTSFDVVKKIRTFFKLKKVGHAGTLDPIAQGLIILATQKMTKQIKMFSDLDKEYYGKMILGAKTPSYDTETEIVERKDYSHITKEVLEATFLKYKGTISQLPPIYSAVKLRGKPLYKYARKGKIMDLTERIVKISELELMDFNPPEVRFRVVCSKGTYIRSLVNDIGDALGCGAYLVELVRTKIGQFNLDDALDIEDLTRNVDILNAIS